MTGADLRLNSSFKDRGTVLAIPGELELPGVDSFSLLFSEKHPNGSNAGPSCRKQYRGRDSFLCGGQTWVAPLQSDNWLGRVPARGRVSILLMRVGS